MMSFERKKLEQLLEKAGIKINGPNTWDVQIHNPDALGRILSEPSIGAGETYMEGWWDCNQLDELFYRVTRFIKPNEIYQWHTFFAFVFKHYFMNQQNRQRSQEVAKQHYNLGNDLYEAMLGPSMAYTCGYWSNKNSLEGAQEAKYDLICKKLNLQPNEDVLELGCGFGGFAKFAAENYNVKVIAVNISTQQMVYAKKICQGLPVELHITDYRNTKIYNPTGKKFSKVVSIGLCEHIGHRNYRSFLKIVRENLADDGLFLMHTIGKNRSINFADPWIRKYIFPNGMLPSIKQIAAKSEDLFVMEDLHNFGNDYDKTLLAWHKNFINHWPELKKSYSERFCRMWNYYLLSCAGAFRARTLQLWQFVFSPEGKIDGYRSIR